MWKKKGKLKLHQEISRANIKIEVNSLHNSLPHLNKTKKSSLFTLESDMCWQKGKDKEERRKQYPTTFISEPKVRQDTTSSLKSLIFKGPSQNHKVERNKEP